MDPAMDPSGLSRGDLDRRNPWEEALHMCHLTNSVPSRPCFSMVDLC